MQHVCRMINAIALPCSLLLPRCSFVTHPTLHNKTLFITNTLLDNNLLCSVFCSQEHAGGRCSL